MLSDICHEFCSNAMSKTDDAIRAGLPQLKEDVQYYRDKNEVYKYHTGLFDMIDEHVKQFEEGKITGERLWTIVAYVVEFLDDPKVPNHDVLWQKCGYTPK